MTQTISEVLQFIEENNIKFIRLAFCDIFGTMKNISIMPHELERAFACGVAVDAAAVQGFRHMEESDLLLLPDAGTLSILPWRSMEGRVARFYCNIQKPDGSFFCGDSRRILQEAAARCANLGYHCKIGPECEFYLLRTDENGDPTRIPMDNGGYCDISPLDRGENIRREICLTLEDMGILPENSHHEQGPGQNEIDFRCSGALNAADDLLTCKWAVRAIAARNGLYATFLPKPFPGQAGSSMHANLSLYREGENIFADFSASPAAQSFLAGILRRAAEMTVFLNPLANSYRRFADDGAPRRIGWSAVSRQLLVRLPGTQGDRRRMELRSPDPTCNPYLAFALLLQAGLDGIEEGLALPAADTELGVVPATLQQAVQLARSSEFLARCLPEKLLAKYLEGKEEEWRYCQSAQDQALAEQELYYYL